MLIVFLAFEVLIFMPCQPDNTKVKKGQENKGKRMCKAITVQLIDNMNMFSLYTLPGD